MSNPVDLVSRSPSKRRAISQPRNIGQTGNQVINSVSKVFCFQVFPFYTNHLAPFCGSNLRNTLEEFLQLMDLLDFVGPGSRSRWHWHECSPRGDAVPDIANIDFILWTFTSTQRWIWSTLAVKGQRRDLFVMRQKFKELRKKLKIF